MKLAEKLTILLKDIIDTYDDFVRHISEECDTDEKRQQMIDYIANNADATSSDVMTYLEDEIGLSYTLIASEQR